MLDTTTRPASVETNKPQVLLSLSTNRGWEIHVQLEGQTIASEHYRDWHRVERRRAWLQYQLSTHVG